MAAASAAEICGAMSDCGFPRRIVCLTEETTETLYLLGEDARIAGISGFTTRPPQARREKPKVSAFTSANIDRILALKPDLVIGFSDLQAEIARELIQRGCNVIVFNQRSVEEILDTILAVARIVGSEARGLALVALPPPTSAAVRAYSSKNGTTRSSAASAGSMNCSNSRAAKLSFPNSDLARMPKAASSSRASFASVIPKW
jgi:ABC-type hemin transport system substrate-binding protein